MPTTNGVTLKAAIAAAAFGVYSPLMASLLPVPLLPSLPSSVSLHSAAIILAPNIAMTALKAMLCRTVSVSRIFQGSHATSAVFVSPPQTVKMSLIGEVTGNSMSACLPRPSLPRGISFAQRSPCPAANDTSP